MVHVTTNWIPDIVHVEQTTCSAEVVQPSRSRSWWWWMILGICVSVFVLYIVECVQPRTQRIMCRYDRLDHKFTRHMALYRSL